MAKVRYMVHVFKDVEKFEGILDASSIFVDKFAYKKIEDGKYLIYCDLTTVDKIEKLVKRFARGTRAIRSVDCDSSAAVQMNEKTNVIIQHATPEAVVAFVDHLAKINNPEWVLMYLTGYNYEEEEDEYI
jgi:hypothetical protein